jgi:hypothetical protein
MKRRYDDGGEIDAMQAANMSEESQDIADSMKRGAAGTSETVKATPKPMRKSAPKAAPKSEARKAAEETDETKMSLAERAKMSRERARAGSGATDMRSVGERIRSAMAGKDRGGNTVDFAGSGMGMKRGGSVSSASRRADGIASKGKTKGTMVAMCGGGMYKK